MCLRRKEQKIQEKQSGYSLTSSTYGKILEHANKITNLQLTYNNKIQETKGS